LSTVKLGISDVGDYPQSMVGSQLCLPCSVQHWVHPPKCCADIVCRQITGNAEATVALGGHPYRTMSLWVPTVSTPRIGASQHLDKRRSPSWTIHQCRTYSRHSPSRLRLIAATRFSRFCGLPLRSLAHHYLIAPRQIGVGGFLSSRGKLNVFLDDLLPLYSRGVGEPHTLGHVA